ncbi:MAG: D-amino acid dehydrogenase, partial [Rhodobacteraceae bacterium]|nr:D-amino acid dehydrogenase [Paracoccaceae bacterium]
RPDLQKLGWMAQMLANCTGPAYARNKGRMVRLAAYSRDCLAALRAETGISYDERMQGTLQLFRTEAQVAAAEKDIKVLKEDGVPFEVLSPDDCVAAEPGLATSRDKIAGGLRLPGDETGDCFKFTNRLMELARAAGVEFRWNVAIDGLEQAGGRITGVRTARGPVTGDAYVVAMGSYSPALLRPLGMRLPVYPVKGYSITVPIVDAARAPVSTVMDETYKIAITRLGDRIRVGGMAEIAGFDLSLNPRRRETLVLSVEDLFGGAGDQARSEFWCGLRPMTPDGTPVIGRTHLSNLYLNTGHGTLGWTMSTGSARLLTDILSDRATDINAADYAFARYGADKGASVAPIGAAVTA